MKNLASGRPITVARMMRAFRHMAEYCAWYGNREAELYIQSAFVAAMRPRDFAPVPVSIPSIIRRSLWARFRDWLCFLLRRTRGHHTNGETS